MVCLNFSFDCQITPIAPYSFKLTAKKPSGWPLFTPLEIYEEETIWTALNLNGQLVGAKLSSMGTVDKPSVQAKLFLEKQATDEKLDKIKESLIHCIGADENLQDFYDLAKNDSILKYAAADLYGMHSTSTGDTIFPDAVLAILLQMAPLNRSNSMIDCVIRKYGEKAEFDGKTIPVWPIPKKLSKLSPETLAENCRVGYRAKRIVQLAEKLEENGFPTLPELEKLSAEEAKCKLLELPGIGDYSADIINPHGGFPIDVWSVEVFGKLFFGKEPENNRQAVEEVKREGVLRWGHWSWMAFFYVVQDLEGLSKSLNLRLRLT